MAWTQEEEELYINGFNTIDDVINAIKDRIDAGDSVGANDDLDQLKDYLKARLPEDFYCGQINYLMRFKKATESGTKIM